MEIAQDRKWERDQEGDRDGRIPALGYLAVCKTPARDGRPGRVFSERNRPTRPESPSLRGLPLPRRAFETTKCQTRLERFRHLQIGLGKDALEQVDGIRLTQAPRNADLRENHLPGPVEHLLFPER
jgi:hypothetical protein